MAITNATRLSDFAAGIGTEGAILKIDNANQRVGIGTQFPDQMLQVAGIVSATQYIGDGSLLEGITSAGLGTAIDDTDGSAGAVIYYTNDLLNVTETTTINPPASASAAYTQYRDVKLNDNVDLIIETGDDFIPDVLGLGTDASDPTLTGNGVFDEVYSGIIKNKDGLGAPVFPNGLTSVGVITAASGSFSGNVTVGGVLTYEDVTNIDSVGLITARTGIKVTAGGIDVTAGAIKASTDGINATSNLILKTGGTEQLRIESGGDIGINATNPGSRLAIYDADGDNLLLASHNYSGEARIGFTGNQGTGGTNNSGSTCGALGVTASAPGGSATGYMSFYTNQGDNLQERLRIGAEGQFGIGGATYGTAGQVLKSGGPSAAPSWGDAGGGEWTLLGSSSGDISNGTDTIDITTTLITSTYYRYKLVFNLNCDAGIASGKMGFRVRVNNSWESAAYYRTGYRATSGSMSNAANDRAVLVEDDIRVLCGEMILWNPSTASNRPHDIFMSGFALNNKNLVNSSGYWVNQSYIQVDQNNSTNYPITGIQFRTQRTIVDYNPDGAQRTFWVLYGAKT